jgi:hypothetical protein
VVWIVKEIWLMILSKSWHASYHWWWIVFHEILVGM